MWKRLVQRDRATAAPEDRVDFTPLAPAVLADVLPDPSWNDAASDLARALDPWLFDSRPARSCVAVIGPPGSGAADAVAVWAKRHSGRVVDPPPREALLGSDPEWWSAADPDPAGVLVIPRLEAFYLRHHDGLDLIRRFVHRMWTDPRRVVIGCDSWAWAYLCRVVQLDSVCGPPLALMPFDADSLREWFRPRPRGRYLVKTVRGGNLMYPCDLPDGTDPADPNARETEPVTGGAEVFQWLASTARGIPTVALALWRRLLCEGEPPVPPPPPDQPGPARPTAIRVRPPQDLALPGPHNGSATREAVVLHTLLLHGGLPIAVLFRLVPYSVPDVVGVLSAMQTDELIADEAGIWRVTPQAYPAVRGYLRAEGYLVDPF